jgi:hypothetical protein
MQSSKFFSWLSAILLVSTLFINTAQADVDAHTCNVCTDAQKAQSAIIGRQQNQQSTQYVLDLTNGTLNKCSVYLDNSCRNSTGNPVIKDKGDAGCGSFWAADEEVVEPELLEKGRDLSTVFLYYGHITPKIDVNVGDLATGGVDDGVADIDAFDYANFPMLRNLLHDRMIDAIKDAALSDLNPTIARALENLWKPLDRLFADGKIMNLDVTIKFKDGSQVTMTIKDEHDITVKETPQDANHNNVPTSAGEASGTSYGFYLAPTDYSDWVRYMQSLGVHVTKTGSGGAPRGTHCSTSHGEDGITEVKCVRISAGLN